MSVNINYYGDYELELLPEKEVAKSKEVKNLLLGLQQKIMNVEKISAPHNTDWFNSPIDCQCLTDGKYAEKADCNDPAYFHFTVGCARAIFFDLGSVCAVESAGVSLLREDAMTSTPALGTLIGVSKTDDVAAAYAATYPIALIAVVLVSQFLVVLF